MDRTLDHPNIRLQLDMFHLQQMEGNLSRNMEKYLPYVGHVQVAQVRANIITCKSNIRETICRFLLVESLTLLENLTTDFCSPV